MRPLYAICGAIIGPMVGSAYALFMRVVNFNRKVDIITPRAGLFAISHPVRLVRLAHGVPPTAAAVTLGHTIYVRRLLCSSQLVRHELVHVEQFERWGWLGFFIRYGHDIAQRGYHNSVIEEEARSRSLNA